LNGWSKIAITAVISVLATSGIWNAFAADRPTRTEVKQMVQEIKNDLKEGQRENRQAIKDLSDKLDKLMLARKP